MAVSETLASVSDDLFKVTVGTYALTMVAFTAEYAFGHRGRVAKTAAPVAAKVPVTVGAGGSAGAPPPVVPARVVDTTGSAARPSCCSRSARWSTWPR